MENIKYTVIDTDGYGNVIQAELENGVIMIIPTDPANSDYQTYLASLDDAAN